MADTKKNNHGTWECDNCGEHDKVTNGWCPSCGPTQTTPLDPLAEKLAGVPEANEARKAQEEANEEARGENATDNV